MSEGQCHSGENHDCHGSANLVTCCNGAQAGAEVTQFPEQMGSEDYLIAQVGPTDQCTWEYSGHGTMLECGRSDEVLVGR